MGIPIITRFEKPIRNATVMATGAERPSIVDKQPYQNSRASSRQNNQSGHKNYEGDAG
jgi:hypothetical protein